MTARSATGRPSISIGREKRRTMSAANSSEMTPESAITQRLPSRPKTTSSGVVTATTSVATRTATSQGPIFIRS